MQPSARTPVLLSIGAHAALLALAWRARTPESPLALAAPLVAMELEWIGLTPPERTPPAPSEPAPPELVRTRIQARRAPTVASHAAIPEQPAQPSATPAQPAASEPTPRAGVTGMNLLRSMSRDAFAQERWRFGRAPVEGPLTPEQVGDQRALARNVDRIRDAWRETVYRDSPPARPSGSTPYTRRVASEVARAWSPVVAQDPGLQDSFLRLLTAGYEGYMAAQRDSLGMFAQGRAANAASDVEAAHPHSPMLQSNPTLNQAGRAMARRIAVEIDVRQSADGALQSIRVARTSGTRFFDEQALTAVRRAVERAGTRGPTERTPGPTLTRWEFELRLARNPPMSLGPQLPGSPAVITPLSGGVEWGGVDPPRAMYPFALHRYQRVRALWVVDDRPAPDANAPRGDAGGSR